MSSTVEFVNKDRSSEDTKAIVDSEILETINFSHYFDKIRDTMKVLIMGTKMQEGIIIFSIVFVLLFLLTIFEFVISTKKFICYTIILTILTFLAVRLSVMYELFCTHGKELKD